MSENIDNYIDKMKNDPIYQLTEMLGKSSNCVCIYCNKIMAKWGRIWETNKNTLETIGPFCEKCYTKRKLEKIEIKPLYINISKKENPVFELIEKIFNKIREDREDEIIKIFKEKNTECQDTLK